MDGSIAKLKNVIDGAERVVLFTGAGFSVPSGIPDFRSAGGIYEGKFAGYSAEYMLSHECLVLHPELFFEFYKSKMLYPDAQPNAAHRYFAELERQGKLLSVVTQNIDGLHQKAGSRRVYELHGSIYRNHCLQCGLSAAPEQIRDSEDVPRCPRCGGLIKPDVVLYGEPLDEAVLRAAVDAIARADLLIVGGTSLTVYPAAGLLDEFRGDSLVVINRTPTAADRRADLLISEPIGEVLQSLMPHIPAPPREKSRP